MIIIWALSCFEFENALGFAFKFVCGCAVWMNEMITLLAVHVYMVYDGMLPILQ